MSEWTDNKCTRPGCPCAGSSSSKEQPNAAGQRQPDGGQKDRASPEPVPAAPTEHQHVSPGTEVPGLYGPASSEKLSDTPISDAAMFVYNDYGEQAVPMNVARRLELSASAPSNGALKAAREWEAGVSSNDIDFNAMAHDILRRADKGAKR